MVILGCGNNSEFNEPLIVRALEVTEVMVQKDI